MIPGEATTSRAGLGGAPGPAAGGSADSTAHRPLQLCPAGLAGCCAECAFALGHRPGRWEISARAAARLVQQSLPELEHRQRHRQVSALGVLISDCRSWGRNRFNLWGRLFRILANFFCTPRGDRPLLTHSHQSCAAGSGRGTGSFPLPRFVFFLVLMIRRVLRNHGHRPSAWTRPGRWVRALPSAARPCSLTYSAFHMGGATGMMKAPFLTALFGYFLAAIYPPPSLQKRFHSRSITTTPD